MAIFVGILFFLFLAVLVVFLFCYKIPQLLQVLLMRSMMNKVVERGYVSKIKRWKNGLARILLQRSDTNDANNNK